MRLASSLTCLRVRSLCVQRKSMRKASRCCETSKNGRVGWRVEGLAHHKAPRQLLRWWSQYQPGHEALPWSLRTGKRGGKLGKDGTSKQRAPVAASSKQNRSAATANIAPCIGDAD